MKTKFKRSTTLSQAIEELEYNGVNEITRVIQTPNGDWIFEYNVN